MRKYFFKSVILTSAVLALWLGASVAKADQQPSITKIVPDSIDLASYQKMNDATKKAFTNFTISGSDLENTFVFIVSPDGKGNYAPPKIGSGYPIKVKADNFGNMIEPSKTTPSLEVTLKIKNDYIPTLFPNTYQIWVAYIDSSGVAVFSKSSQDLIVKNSIVTITELSQKDVAKDTKDFVLEIKGTGFIFRDPANPKDKKLSSVVLLNGVGLANIQPYTSFTVVDDNLIKFRMPTKVAGKHFLRVSNPPALPPAPLRTSESVPFDVLAPAKKASIDNPIPPLTRSLALGAAGDDVCTLQRILANGGFLSIVTPTCYYGALTQDAVKLFQQQSGIDQAGVVGPKTLQAINQLQESSGFDYTDASSFSDTSISLDAPVSSQITSVQATIRALQSQLTDLQNQLEALQKTSAAAPPSTTNVPSDTPILPSADSTTAGATVPATSATDTPITTNTTSSSTTTTPATTSDASATPYSIPDTTTS